MHLELHVNGVYSYDDEKCFKLQNKYNYTALNFSIYGVKLTHSLSIISIYSIT